MKWLSVLALCAALFIAATHASHLQDKEGMMDRADKDKALMRLLLKLLTTVVRLNEQARDVDDEETAINKGTVAKNLRLEDAQKSDQANSQWWWVRRTGCHCAIPPCRCAGK